MSSFVTEKCKRAVGKVVCTDFRSRGSGFFVNKTGLFVTNNHVVTKTNVDNTGAISLSYSKDITVKIDDRFYAAQLVINEESDKPYVYDYAILQVEGISSEPISIGDPSKVRHGESVLAIGFPAGFETPIVTSGVISAVLPRPSHRNTLFTIQTFLTDVLITYGSSGGPLIREFDGTVIGLTTMPHEVKSTLKDKLNEYALSDKPVITPPIRDLINYVLTFVNEGYNYAVSINHVTNDEKWKTVGGTV